jgi:translocator protein
MNGILLLVLCIGLCQMAGFVGAWASGTSVRTWYPTLRRPWFTPPGWVFPVVWTTLFGLMGISLWLVWGQGIGTPGVRTALIVFSVHMGLNILWSILFFTLRNPGLALIEVVAFWLSIVATMAYFAAISSTAALLLAPYLLWVTLAAVLNWSFWRLNPGGRPPAESSLSG